MSVISKKVDPKVKALYTDILCQTFSPCNNFLVAGSIFGDLYIFDMRTTLSPPMDNSEMIRKPCLTFPIPIAKAACSLASTEKFVIVGSVGKVFGYNWKAILSGKIPKLAWSWELPDLKDEMESVEANVIVVSEEGRAYVGCGDKNIHVFSLEDGRLIKSLKGHEGYIHDLSLMDDNQLASAGEDGSVRLWDLRTGGARGVLEPYKQSDLERPTLGKWVGAVYVDKEWMVCGGGVRAGLWHIPTMQLTSPFLTNDNGIHVVMMNEERVFIGDRNKLSQFNLLGEHLCSIQCSSNTLLSLAYAESPTKVLSISGSSQYLDVCINFDARDQVLSCCAQLASPTIYKRNWRKDEKSIRGVLHQQPETD